MLKSKIVQSNVYTRLQKLFLKWIQKAVKNVSFILSDRHVDKPLDVELSKSCFLELSWYTLVETKRTMSCKILMFSLESSVS